MTPEIFLDQPCFKSTENHVDWDFFPPQGAKSDESNLSESRGSFHIISYPELNTIYLHCLSMFHAPSYHYVSFTQLCIINSCTYWGPIMCLNKKTHTWRDNWNNTMSKMAEKLEAILGSRGMRYLIHPGERYQGSLLKGETPEIHFKGWWRRGRGSIS